MFLKAFVVILLVLIESISAPLPDYTPAAKESGFTRDELIMLYFSQSYTHQQIITFLSTVHGIYLCVRQLKRILRNMKLTRKNVQTDEELYKAIRIVQEELKGSGKNMGYKAMWQRLREKQIKVTQHSVRNILKSLDPAGVELRKRRRLKRRDYVNPGPNFAWHMDGYDKLKPYGFAIHGAIDGFARKMIWLEVGPTNNHPAVIAKYYLEAILQQTALPTIVRADRGTENVHVQRIQTYLRDAHDDFFRGKDSFLYGKSTGNQRIEVWWGMLRKQCVNYWMNLFKDMISIGLLDMSNVVHARALQFCFMDVIRDEIQRTAMEWNKHRIRANRNAESPGGMPDHLYYCPQTVGANQCGQDANWNTVNVILTEVKLACPSTEDADRFCEFVKLMIGNYSKPKTAQQGLDLYARILRRVNELENSPCQ